MKAQILRYASIGMATIGLGLGVAAASSATIDETGPDSHNKITVESTNKADIDNHNDVDVNNSNSQSASTGEAEVEDNTRGGDATSGDAMNDNSTDTSVSVTNGGMDWGHFFGSSDWDASINNTGPDSKNEIKLTNKNTLEVENHNDVTVNNNNSQSATSGEASVEHNTTGGDATSGSASNTNSTTTEVTISN